MSLKINMDFKINGFYVTYMQRTSCVDPQALPSVETESQPRG